MNPNEFGVNLYLHSVILSTILANLFHSVVSKVERGAIQDQLRDVIGKAVAQVDPAIFSPQQRQQILAVDENAVYAGDAPTTTLNNDWLFGSTFTVVGLLWATWVLTLWFLYNSRMLPDVAHVLKENLFVFTLVGVVEILFFLNVALKYIPVPPSTLSKVVKAQLVKALS
jgi:hypothetical protein